MFVRPIGMELMEYYRLLKKIRIYWESGEGGLKGSLIRDIKQKEIFMSGSDDHIEWDLIKKTIFDSKKKSN